jgi:hypothetical protein
VQQADGSLRPTGSAIAARLNLGSLDEETAFLEFDVDCDADIILGYDWLRAHNLAFLYDSDEVCLCAERGCTSDRSVRLDLTLNAPASPATSLSTSEANALLGLVGLGADPTLGRPSLWSPLSCRQAAITVLAAAAEAAWVDDALVGLAECGTMLPDSSELFVGRISFAAEWHEFNLQPADGEPPDFAALTAEYCDILAGPPPGLPPDRGPAFELRIDTGSHPMQRSEKMKRWSQGVNECLKQVAFLLDQG